MADEQDETMVETEDNKADDSYWYELSADLR